VTGNQVEETVSDRLCSPFKLGISVHKPVVMSIEAVNDQFSISPTAIHFCGC
jgi:hypothetical protein